MKWFVMIAGPSNDEGSCVYPCQHYESYEICSN